MSLRRILVTWLVLAVLMTGNGAFREFFLEAYLPPGGADAVSALLGIALIVGATTFAFAGSHPTSVRPKLLVSAILVGLTITFEFTLGRIEGKSWGDLVANYRFWEGRWWPLVLLVLAATPFIRMRSVQSRPSPG